MKEEYDFSQSTRNPYIKKQSPNIKLEQVSVFYLSYLPLHLLGIGRTGFF